MDMEHGARACCLGSLEGDPRATFGKAEYLLRLAESELGVAKRSRARRREAANKGWLALTAAADAAGMKRSGTPTTTTRSMFNIVRTVAGPTAELVAHEVRAALHEACFHNDSDVCTPRFVRFNFGKVRGVLKALKSAA